MQVSKWGNSLAVRLPKSLVTKLGLKAGDDLAIVHARESGLEVEKADARQIALAELETFDFALLPGYAFDREEANAR